MLRSLGFTTLVVATLVVQVTWAIDLDVNLLKVEVIADIPTECPKVDPIDKTIHLAHEWDCTKFYKCDHGKRVLFECPVMDAKGNRLYFNPILEVCDWPEQSGCISGTKPTIPTTSAGTTSPRTTTIKTTRPTDETTTIKLSTEGMTETTTPNIPTEKPTESTTKQASHRPTTEYSTNRATQPTTSKPWTKPSTDITTKLHTHEMSTDRTTEPTTRKWSSERPTERPTTHNPSTAYPTKETTQQSSSHPWTEGPTDATTAELSSEIATESTRIPTSHKPFTHYPTKPAIKSTTPRLWTEKHTESTTDKTTSDRPTKWTHEPTTHKPTTEPTMNETTLKWSTEISYTGGASTEPTRPSTNATTAPAPITTNATTEPAPITSNATTEPAPITTNATTEPAPITTNATTEPAPITTNATTELAPITTNATTEPAPITTNATTEPVPITTNGTTEPAPIITNATAVTTPPTQKTTIPTAEVDQNSTATPAGIFLPHESDCSLFYEVVNNKKILKKCPIGLHFSPTKKICVWPEDAGCLTTTLIPTETTTDAGKAASCGKIVHHWVVAHECVCSKYYLCSNGDLILKECPEGLHFNPYRYGCEDPQSAGCEAAATTEIIGIDTTTILIPTECPPDNSGPEVSLPHETNCSLYYKCDNGNKVLQQCPGDLHFNPQLQMCEWSDSAGCIASTTTVKSSVGTTSPTKPGDGTTPGIPTECPPDNVGEAVLLPHPHNCSLFYKCDGGEKVVQSCSPGLEFNAKYQVCDWPEFAGCVASTTEEPWTTWVWSTSTRRPISTTEKLTEGPSSTTKRPTAPPSTTQASTERPSSTTEDLTTTENVPSIPCVNGEKLPHEKNCSLYYECKDGVKEVKQCSWGLHFNPSLGICDWPAFAGCESPTVNPTDSSPSIDGSATTPEESKFTDDYVGQDPSTVQPTEKPSPPPTTTTESGLPSCIGTCPARDPAMAVLLPNEDCTKFCKCSNGRAYVYDCPAKLHFNPIKHVCDYPRRAKCEGKGGYGHSKV